MDYLLASIRHFLSLEKCHAGPSLPTELWILILETACRPTVFIGDETCPPDMIEICIRLRTHDKTANAARWSFRANRKRLKAVCRLWRQICDSIYEDWVLDVTSFESSYTPSWLPTLAPFGKPNKQGLVPRVNILHYGSILKQFHYIHPILSLTFMISTDTSRNVYAGISQISSIIKYPTYLNSLHLSLDSVRYLSDSLLDPLASMDVPLLTLSLDPTKYALFDLNLTFPHLTTLFLPQPSADHGQQDAMPTAWNLPSLINLSLTFSKEVHPKPLTCFISNLLDHHSSRLRALRLLEAEKAGIDMTSPAFWKSLSRLEVFATNFASLLPKGRSSTWQEEEAVRELLRRAWHTSHTLRHLIQSGHTLPTAFLPGLKVAVEHCSKLDTVSLPTPLVPSLFLEGIWRPTNVEYSAFDALRKTCTSRGVKILDRDNFEGRNVAYN